MLLYLKRMFFTQDIVILPEYVSNLSDFNLIEEEK
jgi:hypothetical protein